MSEKEYSTSFNNGYLLQKHKPELTKGILEALKDSEDERSQGMIAGAEQYRSEKLREELGQEPNYADPDIEVSEPEKDRDLDEDLSRG